MAMFDVGNLAVHSSVAILSGAICYGMFVVLTFMALHMLSQRPHPNTRSTKILRWTILFLFCIFTVSFGLQEGGYIAGLRWPRLASSDVPWGIRLALGGDKHVELVTPMLVLHPIPYIAADAIPIWRAYILWTGSRKVRVLLVIVCGINAVLGIARSIVECWASSHGQESIYNISYPTQLGFSIFTNIMATAAIGVRAWQHHSTTQNIRRSSSSPLSVLIVLVEAGAILCVAQIIILTMGILGFLRLHRLTSPYWLTAVVLGAFGDTVVAAYPALTVIILSAQSSILDRTEYAYYNSTTGSERDTVELAHREARVTRLRFEASGQTSESGLDLSTSREGRDVKGASGLETKV
ncbi:hypothetical protein DL96DRAFT_1620335 [Flagelloscypha sp. PMI_526]|nr:hypothetical protein DL96DRAFT_1620335 [Flagelloscypha sp. PMI_526]